MMPRIRMVVAASLVSIAWASAARAATPPPGGLGGPLALAAATPACFGAAARDPENPCFNRDLSFKASPSPYNAPLEPSAPCKPIKRVQPPACGFGPSRRTSASSVALVGDSHATALRAAVAIVARRRQWHGVSVSRNGCPYTFAKTAGPGRCKGWAGAVTRWLRRHPEVEQIIVSANSGTGVVAARGRTLRATKINGYIRAWKAVPRSVRDIYVVRDVPHGTYATADCVSGAVRRQRNPALRCARPRARALQTDEAADAAQRTNAKRVHLIDLSSHMCDDEACFPVVGGALVIRDIGHLTRTFSRTLGPFMDRAISRLLPVSAR